MSAVRNQAGSIQAAGPPPPSPAAASVRSSTEAIDAEYSAWVLRHDTLGDADRTLILADIARMKAPPTLALVLPVGFGPVSGMLETLASLHGQFYPYWELCIAGEPSAANELLVLAAADPRLRIVDRNRHAEPAAAAAAALAHVEDRHVALLAEGDRLPPHALYEVALELSRFPDTLLLYTDEDRIAGSGYRSAPRFKPGWDADLLLAHDYVGALAFYDRATLARAGVPRAGFGGAYRYDLALRATARMMPDRVRHLPAVLCHRPAGAAATLRDRALGPDAQEALHAVRDFLGTAARAEPATLAPACHRITWPLPTPAPKVSVIMPTRDRAELLVAAAWGVLLRTDYPDLELLIIDNDSREALTAAAFRDLSTQPRVRIVRHPGRFNFPALSNAGVREARGEVIVLLNNDIDVIHPDWLRELVSHATRPEVGAVGAKLLYADGEVQHGGIMLSPGPNATHTERLAQRFDPGYGDALAVARSCAAVTGACLAMRRSVYQEVGGMDEADFAVAFNDVDLCLRLGERGYRIVWTPFAELFHLESKSRGTADTEEKAAEERREIDLLDRLWRQAFASDPFANPNLHEAWHEKLRLCAPRRVRPWQRGGMI